MSGTMSVAPEPAGIVIVGASLAGLRGAETLRQAGYDGPLTIVGDEPYLPYDRPPLSKHVLAGELAPDATQLPNLVPLDARWRLGRPAITLDPGARTLTLAGGAVLGFDRLLVATGARARPWPDPAGARLAGVHTLRGRDDAASLRADLARGPGHVVIVGAGLIGCEAASCCRDLGLPVTLLDPNPAPLARSLGAVVGGVLAACLRDAGVDFRPGTQVAALEGDEAVRRVRLADGAIVAADLVIVALGAMRATGWLAQSGLRADVGGVTCDGFCRVLAADGAPVPAVYAAGDVARWPIPLYGGRLVSVEHWGNAVEQGRHAARNMLAAPGDQRPYAHLPAFWSSQFGINVKAVGLTEGADSLAVVQGSLAARRFLAVYGRAGRSIAAVSFDEARWLPAYAERVAAGAPFPPIRQATDQPAIVRHPPGFPKARGSGAGTGTTGGRHG
ncbi:NADPH-dependent 2,4-dienoyl-CoA reductase/sulfur reductase-like enzyme [Methylorubrum rhodinum]|uniref:NADPH-dependent 2,4-dienoyl-CoA reductase/sulfur reductase-like enzyme n=1 Tax=Methylorubrum rhodinum TaxID=29428 RepID=A0A840ZSK5_9HYPH|nr:FAD-dependent oxidoreductase [Methylorubrum rhodinum]MBB5760114.1 NADPH-dependent 2,4-dienoyl-CoA reductase/sulfur reductase-like enzyme [Methylorubrum rhodinum]